MQRMYQPFIRVLYLIVLLAVLPGCTSAAAARQHDLTVEVQLTESILTLKAPPFVTSTKQPEILPTVSASNTPENAATATVTATPTVQAESTAILAPTANPDNWRNWPVVPELSQKALQVYQQGLELGNNPHAFSKVGNCQSGTTWFLGMFDSKQYYRLGDYHDLQVTIDYFSQNYARTSVAVQAGWSIASVLNPFPVDTGSCKKKETPLGCELRLNRPSLVVISVEPLGPNFPADKYDKYLRQIVEYTISQGTLPILATKADDLEGTHAINRAIAQVASDYDMPLWTFWASVQDIPARGLQEDGFHLTGLSQFLYLDDPLTLSTGWGRRNLTALQTLDMVRRTVASIP
jgi:hypothetical protein